MCVAPPLPPPPLTRGSHDALVFAADVPAGPNPIDQLRVSAYCGNSALSTDGTVWYTRRADWKGDISGGPDTPVVSLDVVYKVGRR